MNRKLIWLNVLMVAVLGAAGYQWRQMTRKSAEQTKAFLSQPPRPQQVPVYVPAQPVAAVPPANYLPAAQQLLFAKDRNPDEIIDVKPPDPPKPVPPFPAAFGVISMFGDTTVLLAEPGKADQKGYRVGEKVGPFLLTKITQDEITLAWEDKTFTKRLAELTPKETAPARQEAAANAAPAPPPAIPVNKAAITSPEIVKKTQEATPGLPGIDTGAGDMLVCAAGDDSPSGTVRGGWRKVITRGPFGNMCRWTRVGP